MSERKIKQATAGMGARDEQSSSETAPKCSGVIAFLIVGINCLGYVFNFLFWSKDLST